MTFSFGEDLEGELYLLSSTIIRQIVRLCPWDLNGDDIPDFIVGDMQAGEATVFSGIDGTLLYTLAPPGEAGSFAGCHLIDDITGDGLADVICGSWGSNAGAPGGGRAFLFSGGDGSQIRTMTYTVPNGGLVTDVRAAGDFNGDGALDFLIGGTGGGFNGPPTGRIFILAGIPTAPSPDLDGDGMVGPMDLAILLGNWGPCADCDDCPADLDGDCTVGPADLAILLGNWG
ncbi:MAG: VCBS repeat-containing protein [Planctomycetes bacterium]|nr:VCBS repeat-containing protein [Planctomycetota bacterium]